MAVFRIVALKAVATGIIALALTLLITALFVPMMGGKLAGAGLVMTIACPLVTAIPMSALHYLNTERLRMARNEAMLARDELKRAYSDIHNRSREDSLTGVLNRGTFLAELQLACENQEGGGLLFIDLDHFKTINDTFGHATGDAALRRVGRMLLRKAGPRDLVGRLGGEEFAVFLRLSNRNLLEQDAEQFREAVSALNVVSADNRVVPLTASIGTAYCNPGFDPETSLREADDKMYSAKRLGRNLAVS